MSFSGNDKGKLGEIIASKYLAENGFEIVEQNYRFKHGEIDIICKKDGILIFVEVKSRYSLNYGEPEYGVTKAKQKQVRKMASAYFFDKGIEECECRFDAIAILFDGNKDYTLNHIENAF